MEWQPIETAPKDGVAILVYEDGGFYGVARWEDDGRVHPGWISTGCVEDCYSYNMATYWMPLSPPTTE